jgi:hypothetical protein
MANVQRAILLVALLAPLHAHARPLDSARAFTEGLYEAYRHGEPDYLGARASATFAPHLLALMRHDQAATPSGDVGALDGDPICDCQDDGGMKTGRIEVEDVAPGRALATVTLRFPAEVTTVKLDLVSWHGRWRVADVHTKDMPSLVGLLEKSANEAKAKTTPRR